MSKILRKRQKRLARRRLDHAATLKSTKNELAYKAPGSMTK